MNNERQYRLLELKDKFITNLKRNNYFNYRKYERRRVECEDYIIYLDNKVHKLQEKLQQEKLDSIKEINKLRKKD